MIKGLLLFCCVWSVSSFGNIRGSGRNLQDFKLVDPNVGKDPIVNATGADPEHLYPLGRCQGDCDEDSHCMEGLKCFQRDANDAVPGCSGGEQDGTVSDYCIRLEDFAEETSGRVPSAIPPSVPSSHPSSIPSTAPSSIPSDLPSNIPSSVPTLPWGKLAVVSEPISGPLGLCEGDCDSDDDCEAGLICWLRESGDEPIPYCQGSPGNSRSDFCVYEGAASESPSAVPSPEPTLSQVPSESPTSSKAPSVNPTESMVPSVSHAPSTSASPSVHPTISRVPSVTPTISNAPSTSVSPSVHPTESMAPSIAPSVSATPTVVLPPLHDFGALPPSDKAPMTLCEGDCDDDSDCVPGLVCLKRNAGDDVPGCQGDLSSASNFCVKSDTKAPLVDYGESPPDAFKPFRFCEGDCDDDSDCGKGLICRQRVAGEDVPGCEGDFSSESDFCVWP
ncbi:peptidoglycan-binding domain protein [Nitzschia inconspicua]|uniref:Peptidoglycan-binding domain protein n=1 Tax=Nitzschia inconspicua TaxID=303405 RepID=A0A9K3KSA8_9STRA|nr:peptidoglycan-binding domain protein [Nitzschia inconspicua]